MKPELTVISNDVSETNQRHQEDTNYRVIALNAAATIKHETVGELIANSEKIERWLKEKAPR